MRKKVRNRNMSTMVMALVLSAAMGMTALATSGETAGTPGDFTSNEASTDVKILSMVNAESNLSATLPLSVTLAVRPSGAIVSPTAYKLTNTSQTMKIKVTHVQAEKKGDYVFTEETGKKNIGTITLGNDKGATVKTLAEIQNKTDLVTDVAKWTLDNANTTTSGANSMTLRFSGSMKFSDAVADAADAFKVIYTIAKAD